MEDSNLEKKQAPNSNRLRRRSLSVYLLIGCTLAGCDLALVGHDWDRYPSQIEVLAVQRSSDPAVVAAQRGQAVYRHYCQICHGPDGQGNGFNAAMLDPPPRNFAKAEFWKNVSDDQLFQVISQGGKAAEKSVLMPAWGHTLSEQQIRDTIVYLRTVPDQAKKDVASPQGKS